MKSAAAGMSLPVAFLRSVWFGHSNRPVQLAQLYRRRSTSPTRPANAATAPTGSYQRTVRILTAAFLLFGGAFLLFLSPQQTSAETANPSVAAQTGSPIVRVISMDTNVDIVSARYLKGSIDGANNDNVELIVIELDTPGGSLDATRDMVNYILESRVPVVVFVSPEGAQAASAGTFIGAASGLLAMAPATNIGAAAVVDSSGGDLPETLASKVTQDAAALMRSLADERNRNSDALEATILEAAAYSANEAVSLGVADMVVRDLDRLLEQVDGRTIPTFDEEVTVNTANARIERRDMSFVDNIISFLANPNVAFLLISLGTIGLFVEMWSPGLWIPGTLGVAFLALGFVGVGNLDFSWAGVIFLVLAIGLFLLEGQAPGVSYFGIAGTIALVIGGVFLVEGFNDPDLPGSTQTVSMWLVGTLGGIILLIVLWLTWQIRQAAKSPEYVSAGSTARLVGEEALVTMDLDPVGEVHIAGEYWSAELTDSQFAGPESIIPEGQPVKIVRVDGLHLFVEPVEGGASMANGEGSAASV